MPSDSDDRNLLLGDDDANHIYDVTSDDEYIFTFGDDDWIRLSGGFDVINGGRGTDTAYGIYASQKLGGLTVDLSRHTYQFEYGGEGVTEEVENFYGTKENDDLTGDRKENLFWGYDGDDYIDGGGGGDRLFGGDGHDIVLGGEGADRMSGGDGEDLLDGEGGNDLLYGAAGKDKLMGGSGNDIALMVDADDFDGGMGDDTVTFEYVQDREGVFVQLEEMLYAPTRPGPILDEGLLDEVMSGQSAATRDSGFFYMPGQESGARIGYLSNVKEVVGSFYDDNISGSRNDDILKGNYGNDWIDAKGGDNFIAGGHGNDTLKGGDRDTFHFSAEEGRDVNVIENFETRKDILELSFGDHLDFEAQTSDSLKSLMDIDILTRGNDTFVQFSGYLDNTGPTLIILENVTDFDESDISVVS